MNISIKSKQIFKLSQIAMRDANIFTIWGYLRDNT